MTRFLQGLKRDIAQRVETMDYFNLNKIFHKACQAKQHVKEASTWQNRGQRGNQPPTYVQQLRRNFPADNQRRTTFEPRRNAPTTSASQGSNQKNTPTQGNSGKQVSTSSSSGSKAESSNTRKPTRDIECFRCHDRGHYASECRNKCVMIMTDQGYESQSDYETAGIYDDMPHLEKDEEVVEDLDPVAGSVFVTM